MFEGQLAQLRCFQWGFQSGESMFVSAEGLGTWAGQVCRQGGFAGVRWTPTVPSMLLLGRCVHYVPRLSVTPPLVLKESDGLALMPCPLAPLHTTFFFWVRFN